MTESSEVESAVSTWDRLTRWYESVKSWLDRLPRLLAFALLGAAGAFVLFVAYQGWQFLKEFNQVLNLLAGQYGINKWLAKAAAIVVTGIFPALPHLLVKKLWTKPDKKTEKNALRVFAGIFACIYFLGVWAIDRGSYFDHETGKATKYWSMTESGQIKLYDSSGFDPQTQQALREASPGIMRAYEQQQRGESPIPISTDNFLQRGAFDLNTGVARVWYARQADGGFALFDRPGFDPETQAELQAVTREISKDIKRWIEAGAKAERQHADDKRQAVAARAAEIQREKQAAAHAAYVDRYVDRNARTVSGGSNVAISLLGLPDLNIASVENAATGQLRDRGFNIVPLFRPAFAADGLDQQLFQGSPSLVQKLELAKYSNSLLLGVVRVSGSPQHVAGMYLTEVVLNLHAISPATGAVTDQIEIREKGGGLNREASVVAAVDKLAGSLETRLAVWPQP